MQNQMKEGLKAEDDIPELDDLMNQICDDNTSSFIEEAVNCAKSGFNRASIILGWCAAVDQMQRKVENIGYESFNSASLRAKGKRFGHRKWDKFCQASNKSELQHILERDLIIVIQEMDLIDSHQAERLSNCLHLRNQAAHPGESTLEKVHMIVFFSDLKQCVFSNSKLSLISP